MQVTDYLDAAKAATGVPSDRQLAFLLKITSPSLSAMRRGHSFPADETMVRLAKLAKVDPREALLDLAIWRNSDHTTQGVYRDILRDIKRSLKGAAAASLLSAIILIPQHKTDASPLYKDGATIPAHFILC